MTQRIPPYDEAAEESLLGAMLLSPRAIETAHEVVSASDFYRPAHQHVYAAIMSLWNSGQPSDPVTVCDVLKREGLLDAIGGPATLIMLQSNCPATSNAGRYARIVAEMSQYRALIAAALDTVEAGYGMAAPADQLVETFAERLVAVGVTAGGEVPIDLTTLSAFLHRPPEDHAPWVVPGMIRRGWRAIVVAGEGAGKALALDTPVPTPSGWSTMGDLRSGDPRCSAGAADAAWRCRCSRAGEGKAATHAGDPVRIGRAGATGGIGGRGAREY